MLSISRPFGRIANLISDLTTPKKDKEIYYISDGERHRVMDMIRKEIGGCAFICAAEIRGPYDLDIYLRNQDKPISVRTADHTGCYGFLTARAAYTHIQKIIHDNTFSSPSAVASDKRKLAH